MEIITRADARERGLTRYFTGKPCVHGHLTDRFTSNANCTECLRREAQSSRAKDPEKARTLNRAWYAANLEKMRAYNRARYAEEYAERSEKSNARRREMYAKNPGAIRSQNRVNYSKDKEKSRRLRRESYARNSESVLARARNRYATDPLYAFAVRARSLLRGALKSKGFKKLAQTEVILGCSIAEFCAHIERQFLPGMGWHNMHLWHIDHIVPASSAKTQEEAEALNKAGNLRPLWGTDNLKKKAKITHLL